MDSTIDRVPAKCHGAAEYLLWKTLNLGVDRWHGYNYAQGPTLSGLAQHTAIGAASEFVFAVGEHVRPFEEIRSAHPSSEHRPAIAMAYRRMAFLQLICGIVAVMRAPGWNQNSTPIASLLGVPPSLAY